MIHVSNCHAPFSERQLQIINIHYWQWLMTNNKYDEPWTILIVYCQNQHGPLLIVAIGSLKAWKNIIVCLYFGVVKTSFYRNHGQHQLSVERFSYSRNPCGVFLLRKPIWWLCKWKQKYNDFFNKLFMEITLIPKRTHKFKSRDKIQSS